VNNCDVWVRHSLFDPQSLGHLLTQKYGLNSLLGDEGPGSVSVQFYSRSSNDIYKVIAGEQAFMLRVSPYGSRVDYVEGEVDLLHGLAKTALSAPRPIKTIDDSYVWLLEAPEGRRVAVLFEYLAGVPVRWAVDASASRALGRACARLHDWADQEDIRYKRPTIGPESLLDVSMERLEHLDVLGADEFEWVKSLVDMLRPHLAALGQEAPAYGLCHGDIHHANALLHNGAIALLDFDVCGYGYRVYDLATYKASVWNEALQTAFLAGYETVRKISEAESQVMPYFVAARQIWVLGHIALGAEMSGRIWAVDRLKSILDHLRGLAEGLE
jgi:Ser/Thr protein kinase RdoA (MazF antagonist)